MSVVVKILLVIDLELTNMDGFRLSREPFCDGGMLSKRSTSDGRQG